MRGRKPYATGAILFIAVVIGLTAIVLLQRNVEANPVSILSATAASVITFASTPTLPWDSDLPPEKREFILEQEQEQHEARQTLAAMETAGITPSPVPTMAVPAFTPLSIRDLGTAMGAGILMPDLGVVNPPMHHFVTTNYWVTEINGARLQVYAGSFIETPEQGTMVVRWIPSILDADAGAIPTEKAYPIPGASSAVQITGARDVTLEIQHSTGAAFTNHSFTSNTLFFDPIAGTFQADYQADPLETSIPYPEP